MDMVFKDKVIKKDFAGPSCPYDFETPTDILSICLYSNEAETILLY